MLGNEQTGLVVITNHWHHLDITSIVNHQQQLLINYAATLLAQLLQYCHYTSVGTFVVVGLQSM